MNHTLRIVIFLLMLLLCLGTKSCERQKWRLQQREQRRAYYDEQRRKGYLKQDSIYKAQADSMRKSGTNNGTR
ncbi:MAG: hypothetical protein JNL32_07530 [Candidatus Kapabacteria bacterium]|nr:hypothetical protein [Candidatus Kapabacteria bacterium]